MERISLLWAVVLVSILVFMQGSSAVTRVFVQKGKDVLLEVKENVVLKETDILFWRFNQTSNLVRLISGRNPEIFNERVSFLTNYSMKLKNLQAADSGVYDARVIGVTEGTLVKYNITVQDAVSPVKLNVDSVSSSSDSCIINATCSTLDSDMSSTFRCVHHTCNQVGGEQSETTNSGASLRIYLSDLLIFCNHSNQVSWTKNMTEIQDFCKLYAEYHPFPTTITAIGIGIGIAVIIVLIVVYRHCKGRRTYDTENHENTIYATPQVETTQTRDESPPSDASCVSPTSTYSLVGLHPRPAEAKDNPLPESLYATVDKPAKIEKPARPCKNLQEL